MASSEDDKTCAICLGSVKPGQGQAIFTASCSHSFHFSCIGENVNHGNHLCPVCRAKWDHLPFLMPNSNFLLQPPTPIHQAPPPYPLPLFSDDDPLPPITVGQTSSNSNSSTLHTLTIRAVPERDAIASSESLPSFPVLISLKAPALLDDTRQVQRAPLDLVTVLDVSTSMRGSKLSLLKHAVSFVVDNLGPSDRLSVVSFSTHAQIILPLRRMTDRGRADAKWAIGSLMANGSTNIVDGLKKGVQVLEERRHRNPVASIIFLSDGRDTFNHHYRSRNFSDTRNFPDYLNLLPASIFPREAGSHQTIPVHAFGFGSDHDPIAMHTISESSGGTFSFVESYELVQDAFASCIGGLLTVIVQEVIVMVKSVSEGVEIRSIQSGRYNTEISDSQTRGMITVGELYADEEKEFMVNISVPTHATSLLNIMCSYRDVLSDEDICLEADNVEIRRPEMLSVPETSVNLEVDRQRNRISAAEDIAAAQRIAETGDLVGARAVLSNRRNSLLSSVSGLAGDGLSMWLEAEMKETEERMRSQEMYARSGRAYALSNMSAHFSQRATTRGSVSGGSLGAGVGGSSSAFDFSSFDGYVTPSMASMVNKSQKLNRTEE